MTFNLNTNSPKVEQNKNPESRILESADKNIEEALIAAMVLKDHFKNAEITKHNKSGLFKVRLALNNSRDYDEVIKCFDYLPIEPWTDNQKRTVTIDNRYDIVYLLEFGIIDYDNLSDEAKNDLGISIYVDPNERRLPVSAPAFMYDKTKTADMFDPIMDVGSGFRDTREERVGTDDLYDGDSFEQSMGLDERPDETTDPETKYFNHGDTDWLYRQHSKKYDRKPGGKLFRKIYRGDGQFRLVEISESEQADLLAKAKAGDRKAENEILIMNIPLIYLTALRIAKRFPTVNLSDLLQIGIIQMHECIKKYEPVSTPKNKDEDDTNPDVDALINIANREGGDEEDLDIDVINKIIKKAKFSTFAAVSVGYKMFSSVFKIRDIIYRPRDILNRFGKVNAVLNRLRNKGEELTLEKKISTIADELKISYAKADILLQDYENINTIKHIRPEEVENTPELVDDSNGPHQKARSINNKEFIDKAIDSLAPRDAKLVRTRFGFDGVKEHTLEELGSKFDITRERVRQIEARAIRKLKKPSSRLLLGHMTEDDDLKYGVSVKNNGPLVGKPLDPNYINFLNLSIDDLEKIITTDKSFVVAADRVTGWIAIYDAELDRLSKVKDFPNKDKEIQEIKDKKANLYTVALNKLRELEPDGKEATANWQYHIDTMMNRLKNLQDGLY